jgi:hypothetical protein
MKRLSLSLLIPIATISVVASGCGGGSTSAGTQAACDAYFTNTIEPCSLIDPAQLSAQQTTWEQLCGQALALPGSTFGAPQLQACSATLQANGCNSGRRGAGRRRLCPRHDVQ